MKQAQASAYPSEDGLEELIARMRDGDREAAAEFMRRYESRIRRRIRGKLNQPMRRLFDSEEIFSTVRRRLDFYIAQGQLKASADGELWTLVFKMADNAFIDKARTFRHLQSIEGSDSETAHLLLQRFQQAESEAPGGADVELERTLAILNPKERSIALMWIDGARSHEIGAFIGESAENVRQIWSRTRRRLRMRLSEGAAA